MMPHLFLAAALTLNLSIATADADELVNQPISLTIDRPYSQDLRADQSRSFVFAAKANTSYLMEVDQGGLDLEVTVAMPDGESVSINSPLLRDENELLVLEPGNDGECTITLFSDEYTGAVAKTVVQISEINPKDEVEHERLAGLRLLSEASRANHQANLEGWNSALEAYQQAIVHFQNSGDRRNLARSLFSIATIEYWQMSRWARSADLAGTMRGTPPGPRHRRRRRRAPTLAWASGGAAGHRLGSARTRPPSSSRPEGCRPGSRAGSPT